MKKPIWGIFLLITMLTACQHVDHYVDNYFLGQDNTPEPTSLKPIKKEVKVSSLWTIPIGSQEKSSLYLKMQPVLAEGIIYTAKPDGSVHAIHKDSGKILWSQKLATPLVSGPSLGQTILAFGTASSEVLALNKADGKVLWKKPVQAEVLAKPLITQGRLIAKSVDGSVIAYNLLDGKVLWTSTHASPNLIVKASSSPVMLNKDTVLVGYADGKMDAIDIHSGHNLWTRSIAYAMGASDVERLVDIDADPIVQGSTVFLGSFQGLVGALSLNTGEFIWRKPLSIYKNMLVYQDTLYATDSEDVVWSINKYSGRVNWKQPGLKARGLTEPTILGSRLVLGDKTGLVHLLSTKTGRLVGRMRSQGPITTPPLASGSSFYLASSDGSLSRYAVG